VSLGESFDEVIAAARLGADWAVAVIYRDLHPRLVRFFRSQERREADDLVGEVWLAVAQGLALFDGDEAGLRAWVFTIARRRLVDHRRRAAFRRTDAVDTVALAERPGADDAERDALATLVSADVLRRVGEVLSPEQAEVVLLRIVADLDVDSVARIVRKRPGAVRALQHRALKRLAEVFPAEP